MADAGLVVGSGGGGPNGSSQRHYASPHPLWWPNPFHVMCAAWLFCSFRLTIQQCSWDWRVCHELQYHSLSEVLCLFSPIFFSPTRNFGFRCKATNSSGWVFSSVKRTLLEQLCDVYFSADSRLHNIFHAKNFRK
jgi:hypothetical protein